jgi:hypothetical protein
MSLEARIHEPAYAGLWQAFHIPSATEPVTASRKPRGPAVTGGA